LKRHRLGDVRLLPAFVVPGPLAGQVQPPVQGGVALGRGVGQEDAHLAVLDLAQPAAPLAGHAAGGVARLGEAAGVQHQHGVGVAPLLGHVPAQLGHDRLIVPGAGADEVLHRLALPAGEVGDGFGGLAFQVAELALEHHPSQFVLLDAIEAGQVAAQEALQAPAAAAHVGGGDLGVVKQGDRVRVFQQRHPCPPIALVRPGTKRLAYLPAKNGYSPTILSPTSRPGRGA
jgi:hypothetical protein